MCAQQAPVRSHNGRVGQARPALERSGDGGMNKSALRPPSEDVSSPLPCITSENLGTNINTRIRMKKAGSVPVCRWGSRTTGAV